MLLKHSREQIENSIAMSERAQIEVLNFLFIGNQDFKSYFDKYVFGIRILYYMFLGVFVYVPGAAQRGYSISRVTTIFDNRPLISWTKSVISKFF